MDQKQTQSKSQYGTLTAKYDANRDYADAQNGAQGSTATTSQSVAEYGTMTAKYDANDDYSQSGGGQKSSGNKPGQQGNKK
ncbi:Hypothetical protein LUCI_1014 [Lucifera butyrica]|uniref:Uncharacterized protein n=1 Tax=Lucifera butyrica TaxID=1351585 RepID=A0A498R6K5_9FIRM|nr:hypothetical protein [Lucifera butyrica]VBB05803.1 Hypothetical protein LUCI_1014 [Lucifera butyrica]